MKTGDLALTLRMEEKNKNVEGEQSQFLRALKFSQCLMRCWCDGLEDNHSHTHTHTLWELFCLLITYSLSSKILNVRKSVKNEQKNWPRGQNSWRVINVLINLCHFSGTFPLSHFSLCCQRHPPCVRKQLKLLKCGGKSPVKPLGAEAGTDAHADTAASIEWTDSREARNPRVLK